MSIEQWVAFSCLFLCLSGPSKFELSCMCFPNQNEFDIPVIEFLSRLIFFTLGFNLAMSMQVVSVHIAYVFVHLFFSDNIAVYDPVYWQRNKIQVKF